MTHPVVRILVALTIVTALAGCAKRPPSVVPISAEELMALRGSPDAPLVLDVRSGREFRSGHVPGAIHIPHTSVSSRTPSLSDYKERGVVVYCERGPRAYAAEQALLNAGFEKVFHLTGDMAGWRRSELPVER